MPLYSYKCERCGECFDVRHGSNDKADKCPVCGSDKVEKLFTAPQIVFKGSGFYVNDKKGK